MLLVRSGDAEALDQITRCYSDRLLEAGRRHCRTGAEAEDAVQDALLVAAEHLNELRDDRRLEGWLVKVMASACRRIGRGRKNDSALHDSEAEAGQVSASTDDVAGSSAYASIESTDESELVIVVLNKLANPRDVSIDIAGSTIYDACSVYELTGDAPALSGPSPVDIVAENSFSSSMPPFSIAVLVPQAAAE